MHASPLICTHLLMFRQLESGVQTILEVVASNWPKGLRLNLTARAVSLLCPRSYSYYFLSNPNGE